MVHVQEDSRCIGGIVDVTKGPVHQRERSDPRLGRLCLHPGRLKVLLDGAVGRTGTMEGDGGIDRSV